MARKFLYLIAGLTVAVLALMLALWFWSDDLTEMAFVPTTSFAEQQALPPEAWENQKKAYDDAWQNNKNQQLGEEM